MAKKKMEHFVTLSLILVSAISICGASNTTEAAANTVEVKFYRLQVSKWVAQNMETTFHALLANEANSYCGANLAACGLDVLLSSFKESHIGKIDVSPIDDDKDMLYKFYIKYPESSNVSSSSSLQYVLSQAVVQNIVLQLRTNVDYIGSLGCSKCYITYINNDFYGIPPSSTENKIIIPIAFAVLLIVIIIAIALHFWNKKKEKQRKWEQKHRAKPKNLPPPEYTRAADPPSHTVMPDDKINEPKARKSKKDMRQSWEEKKKEKMYSSSSPKKHMERSGGASNDSGLDVDQYERRHKPHALEPLDQADQEVKRKKKKKEKKRSKKSKVEGAENPGYMAEDEEMFSRDMKTEL